MIAQAPSHFRKLMTMLDACPPSWAWNEERAQLFLELGRYFEEAIRPGMPCDLALNPNPLWGAIYHRLKRALVAVDALALLPGEWMLWQMYNSGVILKSRDVVAGMDIVPVLRTYGWQDPEELTRYTAGLLDFLLITHHHPDHYDRALVRACLALGKPVCVPEDIRKDWEADPNLYVFQDGTTITLCDLEITGRRGVHVWRETAEELPLIYYELTDCAGHTVLFAGDADYTRSFTCTPGQTVDALFLPWRNPNARFEEGRPEQTGVTEDALRMVIDRIHPQRIILEHYAELEHIYNGYPASYDLAARLKRFSPVHLEWMFWGERLGLLPQQNGT